MSTTRTAHNPISIAGAVCREFRLRYAFGAHGSRERRTALLTLAIAIMGIADLILTLTYMRSTGMYELNPVARAMVAIGGAQQLVIFKLLSIALGAGILYLLRRRPIAEPAAWGCAAVMCLLSFHWISYNKQIENPAVWHGMQIAMDDVTFTRITN